MSNTSRVDQAFPPQTTPFVGRWDELSRIAELMADRDCRMMTLVGPGGIGKTRLALEALSALASSFPHGVFFTGLQPLSSHELITLAIIEALQLRRLLDCDPKEQLLSFLSNKTMLLLLDNFEHLLDGTPLISELLAHAPGLKLLLTSRERLNIREEWVFDVRGLPFPAGNEGARIEDYSAVQLYVQSARRADPNFLLADEAAPVARICALVDGTPLALELASSWSHVLTSAEIVGEIERGLDILETTARNVPERHRSMRVVMDYSWMLLTEDQRDVFMRLSAFRDGFSRTAAEQVAGATRTTLAALVDKSWLRRGRSGRYDVHELLRQYGAEQLEAWRLGDSVRDVHCDYYASFVEQRLEDLKGRRQIKALAEIGADLENLRTAWYWAAHHKREAEIQKMVEGLRLFFKMRGRNDGLIFRHAELHFRGEPRPERIRVWGRVLARVDDDTEALLEKLETALRIARQYGDLAEVAICLQRLSFYADYIEKDGAKAQQLLEESLAVYRQLGDRFGEADVLFNFLQRLMLSINENRWGDFYRFGDESLRLRREIGDRVGTAWSLASAAHGQTRAGHFSEAERLWLERIALGKEIDSPILVALGYASMSYGAYFIPGDFEKARASAQEALRLGDSFGFGNASGFALSTLGLLASMEEDYEQGKLLSEQAASSTTFKWIVSTAAWGSAVAACGLGDDEALDAFLPVALEYLVGLFGIVGAVAGLSIAAWSLARNGDPVRAVEWLALAFTHPIRAAGWIEKWPLLARLREELEQTLGSEAYRAAWERGKLLDTEIVTAELMAQFSGTHPTAQERAVQPQVAPLSERELAILSLVRDGLPNRDIADRLFLAPTTVKWYLSEIYSKLGVKGRMQAISRARALHLLV